MNKNDSSFAAFSDFLRGPVGNGLQNNATDVKNTKRNLGRIGFFDEKEEGDVITHALDVGIRNFQRENNLRIDGRLFPGGETEREIFKTLEKRDPALFFAPDTRADDDDQSVGFGGHVSGTLGRKARQPKDRVFTPDFKKSPKEHRPFEDRHTIFNSAENAPLRLSLNTEEEAVQSLQEKQTEHRSSANAGGFGQPPENVDATGRMIRDKTPPIPEQKPPILTGVDDIKVSDEIEQHEGGIIQHLYHTASI